MFHVKHSSAAAADLDDEAHSGVFHVKHYTISILYSII
jgi:hypothetical protein